jgi:hypothetical protein
MVATFGASAAVFRDILARSDRMAEELRMVYLQTASRFSE